MQNTIIGNKRFPTHVKRYSPIARGTNLYIPVYIKDDKEQPIDLSTLTAHFTIKRVPTDNDFFDDRAFLAKDIDLDNDDGKNGVFHITASSREMFFDPGEYFFDIELFAPETPITPDDPHPERDRGTISRIIELPFTLIGGVTNRKVNSSDNYAANFGQVNDPITVILSAQSQPIVVVTPPFIDTKVAHSWDNPLLVDGFWYDSIGYLRWPDTDYQIQASDATIVEVEQNRQLSYEYLKLEQDPTTTFWTLSVYNTKANPADWEEIGHTEDGSVRNWQWTWAEPYSWNSLFKEGQISGIPENSNFWMAFDGHLTAETRNQDALVGKLQSLYNTLISVRSNAARQQATSDALLFKSGLWYDNMLSFNVASAGTFVEDNDVQELVVVNNGVAEDFLRMDKVGASGCELYYSQNGVWVLAGQVASGNYASWSWEPSFPQTIINRFQSSFITARGANAANISKSEFWNKMVFNIHYDTSDIVPVLNKFYGLYTASGGGGGGLPGMETDPIYTADKPNIAFKNVDFLTTLTSANRGITQSDLPDLSNYVETTDFLTTLTSVNKGITLIDFQTTLTSVNKGATMSDLPNTSDFALKNGDFVSTLTSVNRGITQSDLPIAIDIDTTDEALTLTSNHLKFVETLSVATDTTNPNRYNFKKTNKSGTTTTWGTVDISTIDTSGFALKNGDFVSTLTSVNRGITQSDLPNLSNYVEKTDFLTTLTSANKGITQSDFHTTLTSTNKGITQNDFYGTISSSNKGATMSDLPDTSLFALKNSDFQTTLTSANKGATIADLPNVSGFALKASDFVSTLTSANRGITQSDLPSTADFALKSTDFQTTLTSANKGATMAQIPDVSGFALKNGDFTSTLTSTNKGLTESDFIEIDAADKNLVLSTSNKLKFVETLSITTLSTNANHFDFKTTDKSNNTTTWGSIDIAGVDTSLFALKNSDFQTTLTSANKGATMAQIPDVSGFALKNSDFQTTLTSANKGATMAQIPDVSGFALKQGDFLSTLTSANKGITQSDLPDTSLFALKASDFQTTLTSANKGATMAQIPDVSGFALKQGDFLSTLTSANKGITQSDLPNLSGYVETTDFLTTLTSINQGITQDDFISILTSTNKGLTLAEVNTTLTSSNKIATMSDISSSTITIDSTDTNLVLSASDELKFVETLNVISSTTNSNIVNFTKTDKNSNTTTWGTIDFGATTQEQYFTYVVLKYIPDNTFYAFNYISTNDSLVTTYSGLYQDMVSSGYNETFSEGSLVDDLTLMRIPMVNTEDTGLTESYALISGHETSMDEDGFAVFYNGGTTLNFWSVSSLDYELMNCKKMALNSLIRPQKYMTHLTLHDGAGAKFYTWSYISNNNNTNLTTISNIIDDMISGGYPIQPVTSDSTAINWFRIPIAASFDHTVATGLSDFSWAVSMSLRRRNPGNVRCIQFYSSIPGADSNGNGAFYINENSAPQFSISNCTKIPL